MSKEASVNSRGARQFLQLNALSCLGGGTVAVLLDQLVGGAIDV
jgi:hypothetical protein